MVEVCFSNKVRKASIPLPFALCPLPFLRFATANNASAEKVVSVKKYCGLTRCRGSLRLGKFDKNLTVAKRCYGRSARLFGIAKADARLKGLVRELSRKISAAFRINSGAVELVFTAEDDVSAFRVDMRNVKRCGRCDSETLALTDRVCRDALVLAEDLAVRIGEIAGNGRIF